ncbi:MAG: hypothetical protein H7Z42_15570 [Roseiflexaceae bacterium]|nr:hypothetical protein [Roseiflexaceae bacterium]
MAELLLIAHTTLRRYAIRHDDVLSIQAVHGSAGADPALLLRNLGTLFDPLDSGPSQPHHGLFVPIRRKQVVFLIEQVELLERPPSVQALPLFLQAHLRQPWSLGVMVLDDEPVILLDLRAVARAVMADVLAGGF